MKQKDNYFKMICIFYIVMIIAGLIFRTIYYRDTVNSEQLNFITPMNDNQAYHPKVLEFDEPWNGYRYWVAFTPYPKGDETKENPVINASNNRVDWVLPEGIENPLDVPEISDKVHYNSDTHLLYNQKLDRLEIFWRYVDDEENKVIIYRRTSTDGHNWSKKEVFLKSTDRKARDFVSPAIIYEDDIYKVWYVDKKAVYYLEKQEDKVSEPVKLDINYQNNYKTWHIDVIHNTDKKLYELIAVAYEDVNHRENMDLYYTSSKDNIKWNAPIEIMSPSTKEDLWDSAGLYRSSIVYDDDKYYIFYSAHDDDMDVGIGLMCGTDIKKLKACS